MDYRDGLHFDIHNTPKKKKEEESIKPNRVVNEIMDSQVSWDINKFAQSAKNSPLFV